eukprot:4649325-Amphidinium_carterae.3
MQCAPRPTPRAMMSSMVGLHPFCMYDLHYSSESSPCKGLRAGTGWGGDLGNALHTSTSEEESLATTCPGGCGISTMGST